MDQAARARGASKPGTGTKRWQPHPRAPVLVSARGASSRAKDDPVTDRPAARLPFQLLAWPGRPGLTGRDFVYLVYQPWLGATIPMIRTAGKRAAPRVSAAR